MDDSETVTCAHSRDVYFEHLNKRSVPAQNSDDEYSTAHRYRGLAVVINNSSLVRQESAGSQQDADYMAKTLKSLQFKVQQVKDVRGADLSRLLYKVSQDSYHGNADCFVCVIIKREDGAVKSQHSQMSVTRGLDVVDCTEATSGNNSHMFNDINCPQLSGKPRLFFIQTISESSMYSDVRVQDGLDEVDACVVRPPAPIPPIQEKCMIKTLRDEKLYKDFLLMYATCPGNDSNGRVSRFTQLLCQALTEARGRSLLRMLTCVCGQMIKHNSSVPCIYSKLTRDLVFKNKQI
ncbi:caspase-like [Liolophura sinensis]|uniref:caspase-like n=1 Tax=Liolophura sinensis TaxID=3198878 RepID=UPI00315869C4